MVSGANYVVNTEMPGDRSGAGEPYAGTIIPWHNGVRCKVNIVSTGSGQASSVLVTDKQRQYLIVCVYIPDFLSNSSGAELFGGAVPVVPCLVAYIMMLT